MSEANVNATAESVGNGEVQMIPIDRIRFLNPRHRDKKKFALILQSIRNLGLKKPIQVSLRASDEGDEPGYDLVYGQGRVEAFMGLGYKEIPAIVVSVSKEDRLLRSLVENMARRNPQPLALMHEIERLKELGYSNVQIGKKLDLDDPIVGGLLALSKAGEERLLVETISGKIPLGVAMDIAKTESVEMQRELLKGYESGQLNQGSIRTLKRLIEQRRFLGKKGRGTRGRNLRSVESLVNAYKRERQRQKMLIRKGKIAGEKVVFITAAFGKLMTDENFANLLRAESLQDMPKWLWDKIKVKHKEGE